MPFSAMYWSMVRPAGAPGASDVFSSDVGDVDSLDLLALVELSALELLDGAVLVSDPQPDSTTARAVTAAAVPVSADALIVLTPSMDVTNSRSVAQSLPRIC